MAAWDETKPAGTDAISSGDDEIRTLKTDIRERMDNEHLWTSTGDNTEGKHNEGSARITTDTSAPANVDDGRLYYDTANKLLKFANGSVFANLDMDAAQILEILGYKFATVAGPTAVTGSASDVVTAAFTKKEASSIILLLGKSVLGTGNGVYTIGLKYNSTDVTDATVKGDVAVTAPTYLSVTTFTVVTGLAAGAHNAYLTALCADGAGSVSYSSLLVLELRNAFAL